MRWMAAVLLLGVASCREHGQPSIPIPGPALAPPQASAPLPAPEPPPAPPPARPLPETVAFKLVMDVLQVVGRSEAEVATLLGPPAACADIHRARLCKYGADGDEVMFVAGKADMITVQAMDAVPFDETALDALGLQRSPPDHSNEHAIEWQSIAGLETVKVFPGQGSAVDYAYVKAGKH